MTKRIVEMSWNCNTCKTTNRGRDMQCASCGNPKDETETYQMPGDTRAAPSVTDPDRLREAAAGKHWTCEYCGSHERDLKGACRNCAAKREDENPKPYVPASTGTQPRPSAPPRQPRVDDDFAPRQRQTHLANIWIALTVSSIFIAFVGLLIWLFLPWKVEAQVTDASWEYVISLQQRHVNNGTGWRSSMPFGAYGVSCQERQRGTERCNPHDCNPHPATYNCRPYDCNCREVCTSLDNGYASCSNVCSTCYETCTRTEYDTCYDECPVFEDWCTYRYDTWPEINREVTHGKGHSVRWGILTAHGNDQKLVRSETYTVEFTEGEERWTYRPGTLDDYAKYTVGSQWTIKVNRARTVRPIEQVR